MAYQVTPTLGVERSGVAGVPLTAAALVLVAVLAFCLFLVRGRSGSIPAVPTVTRDTLVAPFPRGTNEQAQRTSEDSILGRMTILNGERAGERFGLGGSGIRIGREPAECEIVLTNPKISRFHAELVELEGRLILIDRNSSNGTYVNDQKIDKKILEDGDIIYFGGRNAVAMAFHASMNRG